MDNDHLYLAAGLFSPSKARQQEAQAKDWSYVDSWLSNKFASETIPTFERNEQTLQVLLSMAAANERADEQQNLVHQVESAALENMQERASADEDVTIYEAIEASLDDQGLTALHELAETTVMLNYTNAPTDALAHRIIELTNTKFELSQQLQNTGALRKGVESESRRLEELLAEVQSAAFATPQNLPQQTAEWNRGTKHLKAKLAEYQDRLGTMSVAVPRPSMEDVAVQIKEADMLHRRIADVESQLAVFRGLPPNADEARGQLNDAKAELRKLTLKRDQHFERLAED